MSGSLEYVIDANDCILSVNSEWAVFARENLAPHLATGVVGRDIWSFISNVTVRQLYRQLLARVRAGATLRIPFRCDAPELRRDMVLEMRPAPDGAVAFRTHLVSTAAQSHDRPNPPNDGLVVCGWCARVEVEAEWMTTEHAIARLGLFNEPHSPPMTHGICAECHRNVFTPSTD